MDDSPEPEQGAADEPATDEADATSEADEEQNAADVDRLQRALAALDDESLRHGISTMSEQSRADLAAQLTLPKAAAHLGDALVPLVRRKARALPPDRQLVVAFALTDRPNEETIKALGPRSNDPSRDDLLEVFPDVIEHHGAQLATLLAASYAVSDAPCRPVMRELLETDERFAIGEPAELEPEHAPLTRPPARVADSKPDPERDALREQRRAAKSARKAEEAKARADRRAAEEKRRADLHRAKTKTKRTG